MSFASVLRRFWNWATNNTPPAIAAAEGPSFKPGNTTRNRRIAAQASVRYHWQGPGTLTLGNNMLKRQAKQIAKAYGHTYSEVKRELFARRDRILAEKGAIA